MIDTFYILDFRLRICLKAVKVLCEYAIITSTKFSILWVTEVILSKNLYSKAQF